MDNEVGDRLRNGKSEPPDVPTISDEETNVDEVDVDESGTPMSISNGEDG